VKRRNPSGHEAASLNCAGGGLYARLDTVAISRFSKRIGSAPTESAAASIQKELSDTTARYKIVYIGMG